MVKVQSDVSSSELKLQGYLDQNVGRVARALYA